jgi:hypothetical protein
MKRITINNITYTMTPAGYGQYKITDGTTTFHSTNSLAYDWMDDEEGDPIRYAYAINYIMFKFVS